MSSRGRFIDRGDVSSEMSQHWALVRLWPSEFGVPGRKRMMLLM